MSDRLRDDLGTIVDKVGDVGDAAAFVVFLGVISSALPTVATLLTVIWLGLRIWESDTVRELTGRERRNGGDE